MVTRPIFAPTSCCSRPVVFAKPDAGRTTLSVRTHKGCYATRWEKYALAGCFKWQLSAGARTVLAEVTMIRFQSDVTKTATVVGRTDATASTKPEVLEVATPPARLPSADENAAKFKTTSETLVASKPLRKARKPLPGTSL